MVKEKMVEIKANQRRSNICTIGDIKEEKQSNGREVVFLNYDSRKFSVNKMRNEPKQLKARISFYAA